MNGHGFTVNGAAVVQPRDDCLQPGYVILFTLHNVIRNSSKRIAPWNSLLESFRSGRLELFKGRHLDRLKFDGVSTGGLSPAPDHSSPVIASHLLALQDIFWHQHNLSCWRRVAIKLRPLHETFPSVVERVKDGHALVIVAHPTSSTNEKLTTSRINTWQYVASNHLWTKGAQPAGQLKVKRRGETGVRGNIAVSVNSLCNWRG